MIKVELIKQAATLSGDLSVGAQGSPMLQGLSQSPAGRLIGTGAGAGAGGVLGAGAGGLAGLLGHYTLADEKKRRIKDYLKSILLGGVGGAGVGALGGGYASHALLDDLREKQTPVGRLRGGLDTFRDTIGL